MDILSLKAKLLEQHKTDRQLTLKKDALLFLLVVVIAVVLADYISDQANIYPIIVGGVAILTLLVYLFVEWSKIGKRENQIERFIDKIKAGGKAIDIKEYRKYKISIPIRFLKMMFFPVDYISIAFESNPARYYTFPVDKNFVQDIKDILKENSNNLTTAAKHDFLDADLSQDLNEKHIPLKNVDEFKEFLHTKLQFTMKDIEGSQTFSKTMLVIASFVLLIAACGWLYYMYILLFDDRADLLSSPYEMLVVIGIFGAVFLGVYTLYFQPEEKSLFFGTEYEHKGKSSTSSFKSKILHQVVKFINPQAQYVMHGHIDQDMVMRGGLFKNKDYEITGNDLIIGKYNGVRFQFSDLRIAHMPLFSDKYAEPDVVFQGQYFVARLRKKLPTPVYLVYRKARTIQYGMNNISGSEIELEDKDFMKLFEVYAPNTTYAQEVLTPIVIEGLKRVIKRIPGDYYISFFGDLLTIANNSGKDSFEVVDSLSLVENDFELLIVFFKELYGDFTLINDLRLNEYA